MIRSENNGSNLWLESSNFFILNIQDEVYCLDMIGIDRFISQYDKFLIIYDSYKNKK